MEGEVACMTVCGNAGVRLRDTSLAATGNNSANGEVTGQTVTKSSYNCLLPRFNLVLEPADRLLLRAGIARDIRRPNFDTLSTSFSFGTGANTPVAVGNPDLVPEAVWSFDLSGEYYFAPSSLKIGRASCRESVCQ